MKALITGSFDPFTIGHDDIVQRTLAIFDQVIVGVGVNERKAYRQDTQQRIEAIQRLYADEPRLEVKAYGDLTVDFARREGAGVIVKGVRSLKDYEYEREQADINRRISGIDTLLLFADPALSSVSSSMVRELEHFGRDITAFLPKASKKSKKVKE